MDVVDGRRDGIAAAGEQRGGDRALVAIEPLANARVDRIAQTLDDEGKPSQAARSA